MSLINRQKEKTEDSITYNFQLGWGEYEQEEGGGFEAKRTNSKDIKSFSTPWRAK